MNHCTQSSHRNRRTFIATLLTYVMLTSQLAPMAMALNGSTNRRAPAETAETERTKTIEAPPQESSAGSFAPVPVPLRVTPLGSSPIIAATKVDSFPDPDMDGKVSPGQTITYSVTISNTGTDAGSNVTLNDTVDLNTTLVAGSAVATPIAFADAYNVIGNVRIQPNAAQGLLSNDINPNTGNNTGLTASGGTTSTQGGNVAINADGSFSYDPPVGFTGTDTFTYTATSANGVDTRTVTLTVAGMIFFVNDDDPVAGGDGRLTNPFNCLVGAGCFSGSTADEAGDNIFILNGAYTGGLTFLANQKLIGQGATDTLANIAGVGAVQPYSDPLPVTNGIPSNVTITTTIAATNALTVSAGGITLRGFAVGNTTGAKILGSAFGTLTAGNNASPDLVLNGTGQALNLTTGTFAATSGFSSVATTSSGTQGIVLTGVAGTVSFGSTTVSGATTQGILVGTTTANTNFGNTSVTGGTDGVSLQNNSSGTRTFGTLSVTNNTGVAFLHAVGGGATTVTGATTITNPGGIGISVANSTTLVTFANTNVTQSGGAGVSFTGGSGNLTFADLDITPDANQVALLTNGTTGAITSTSGTIVTTGASALSITSTPLALVFDGVTSSGGTTPGISLTTATGSLTAGGGSALTGNNSSAPFTVSGGTVSVTYGGGISQVGPGASLLNISGGHSGTINFNTGLLLATGGNGAQFDNADGTYNFNGQLSCNGGDAAVDILNGSGGTFTFAASANISNPSGVAFFVNGGTASVTYNGSITKTNNALATVQIVNGHSTGTITFQTNAIGVGSGTGLQFSNADGTYNFSVASGNTILNGGDAGIDIVVGSGGTFNFGTGVGIVNPTGIAYQENASTANVTYSGTITKTNNAISAVDIGTKTGGTTTFNGQINASTTTANAINLASNTGGTIAFNTSGNGLDIVTTSGIGFNATGGGTVTVQGSGNTISSGTATALNVSNTNIGMNDLNFVSISTSGASSGIVLNNTGTSASFGGLIVSGDNGTTANGSGGTIQNSTGAGISLTNTRDVSLDQINVTNGGDDGIHGVGVVNFTLNRSNVNSNGNSTADDGLQFGEASGAVVGVSGNVSILNSSISTNAHNNVHIRNTSGIIDNLTVTDSTFNDLNDTFGANSFLFEGSGTSTITEAFLTGSTFSNNSPQRALEVQAHDTANVLDFVVRDNKFANNGIHASFTQDTSSNLRFYCINNGGLTAGSAITGTVLQVINIFSSSTSTGGTIVGNVSGNNINTGATNASGISAVIQGRTTSTLLIDGNTINGTAGARGISLAWRGPTANVGPASINDVTVTNNNANNGPPAIFPTSAISLEADNQSGAFAAAPTVRADIRLNTVPTTQCFEFGTGCLQFFEYDGDGTPGEFQDGIGQLVDTPPASANADAQLSSTNTGSVTSVGISLIAGPINVPPPVPTPLLAAPGGVEVSQLLDTFTISQSDLDLVFAAAIERWRAAGMAAKQISAIRSMKFEIADLPGTYLAEVAGEGFIVDRDGGGYGWFVDSTPMDDVEFRNTVSGVRRYTDPAGVPAGRMDLLTAIMHEMGHRVGLSDSYSLVGRDDLMYGYLTKGERKLPLTAQALSAVPNGHSGTHFLSVEPDRETLSQPLASAAADQSTAQLNASRSFIATPQAQSKAATTKPTAQTPATSTVVVDPGVRYKPKPIASPKGDGLPTPPVIVGNNLTWNVGTLPAGQSVTITFQVTVNTPPPSFTQVSNQGTVTADGGISVLTDDPDVAGANNPTVTLVTAPPDLFVRDARVAEPASGSTPMIFTLALSTPAPTGGITVTLSTANGSATGGTCVAGDDYVSVTGGTATFAVGEQIKTFPVTVCSDANVEGDETFTLNVDSAPGAVIVDGQGLGTITANVAGTTLISELRTSGPNGLGDDFVEIYNNTDTPHTVPAGGYGLFKMGADCNALPVLVGTIPAATVIPQRGHFLFTGSTYSLGASAVGNVMLTTDIESDFNVGLFTTVDPLSISTANRLDAVGFGISTSGVCALLLEGTTLPPASGSTSEYSFVREFTLVGTNVPTPTDGNDNAADFTLVSTTPSTPVGSTAAPRLGAPGPEHLAGPNLKKYSQVGVQLIDPMLSASVAPNRARDTTSDPGNNSLLGTLASRRTFTNNTGAPITRLRFRIYDITTFPSPVGTADLRARTSTNATVTVTGVGSVTALATTLETPPAQALSGGLNSSLAAGTVTMGTPLAAGASIHINFLLGVQQSGSFRVFVFVEAVP